jgi:hypothetical protein
MSTYTHKATGRLTVASWQESAYVDVDGEGTTMGSVYYPNRGLTQAEIGYGYSGEVEGSSVGRMLGAYTGGGHAVFEAFEQFTGSIAGHEGSCVWHVTGTHADNAVTARLEVVAGLGTGGLEGLRGSADLVLAGQPEGGYELVLAYDWE